ncbi:MAG: CcmD family protein [Bacteroidetes bacterium]|nr:MAG: CcmD family protein [Bacteroidota bacterium]
MASKLLSRTSALLLALCLVLQAAAQQGSTSAVPMATGMRAEGKIYVVVAVLLTILAGLFLYVLRLDRKISAIEKSESIQTPKP